MLSLNLGTPSTPSPPLPLPTPARLAMALALTTAWRSCRYFSSHLREFVDSEHFQHIPLCFNILTDGEPDSKDKFERNLRRLGYSALAPSQ